MKLIEELINYFSELLTEEQKAAVEQLFHNSSPPKPDAENYEEYSGERGRLSA